MASKSANYGSKLHADYCRTDLQPQEKEAFPSSPYGVQIPHVQPRNLTLYGDIIHTGCDPYIRFINRVTLVMRKTQNIQSTEYTEHTLAIAQSFHGQRWPQD